MKGFIGVYVDPSDLTYFEVGNSVLINGQTYVVRGLRKGTKGHEVAFENVTNRTGAEEMRGSSVFVETRRELAEGEYWPGDLIGLDVRPGGGKVVDISYGAAQDRLVVERDGVLFEVPFVDDLVPLVEPAEGYVEIVEIEGLSEPVDRD